MVARECLSIHGRILLGTFGYHGKCEATDIRRNRQCEAWRWQHSAGADSREGTSNIHNEHCRIEFTGDVLKMFISDDLMGHSFDGSGKPIDKGPPVLAEEFFNINGASLNPKSRVHFKEMIQIGVSVIDTMNSIVRGQKLPLFSAQVCRRASLSLLMKLGIGRGMTRKDHAPVSNRMYANYAIGQDTCAMQAVGGELALSEDEYKLLGVYRKN